MKQAPPDKWIWIGRAMESWKFLSFVVVGFVGFIFAAAKFINSSEQTSINTAENTLVLKTISAKMTDQQEATARLAAAGNRLDSMSRVSEAYFRRSEIQDIKTQLNLETLQRRLDILEGKSQQ